MATGEATEGVELLINCCCEQLDGDTCARARGGWPDRDEEIEPCECACHDADSHNQFGDDDRCACELCEAPRCGGCGRYLKAEGRRCVRCARAEAHEARS